MKSFAKDTKIEDDFLEACRSNDLEKVKKILKGNYFKSYPNQQLFLNEGLASSTRSGFDVMKYLLISADLKLKADIHENADRPLRLAFMQKDIKYIEFLCASPELKEHANYIKTPGNDIEIPFLQACERGTAEMVKFLLTSPRLKKHVPIDIKDNNNNDGLFEACRSGNLEIVQYLLTAKDLKHKLKLEEKHATWAWANGYHDVFDYLCFSRDIQENVDINKIADYCIFSACEQNKLNLLKYMTKDLGFKMQNKYRNYSNNTAFVMAAGRSDQEMINYILYELNYQPTSDEITICGNYYNTRQRSTIEDVKIRDIKNLEKKLPLINEEEKMKQKL